MVEADSVSIDSFPSCDSEDKHVADLKETTHLGTRTTCLASLRTHYRNPLSVFVYMGAVVLVISAVAYLALHLSAAEKLARI